MKMTLCLMENRKEEQLQRGGEEGKEEMLLCSGDRERPVARRSV